MTRRGWNLLRYELIWTALFSALCTCPTFPATMPRCAEILQEALTNSNPDTRKQAVIALSLLGAREPFLSRLDGMLADSDVEVRLAAVASLAEVKTSGAKRALHGALNDAVPEVRFAAAKALWGLHDPAGEQALLAVLEGDSKPSSSVVSKQKRDALRMMHTPRAMFLFALRHGIGFVPIPGLGQGIASMQAILTDPGVSGRAAAALMLANGGSPGTVDALKDALHDKDWSVRAAAVHALAVRNNPALSHELVALLEDDKQAVRLRAAAACLRLSAIQGGNSKL